MKFRRKMVLTLGVLFLLFNVLAYHHAGSFFFYADDGHKTPSPESLSRWQKAGLLFTGIRVPKPLSHTTPAAWNLTFEDILVPGRNHLHLSAWLIPSEVASAVTVLFHGYSSEKSGILHEATQFHDMGHHVVVVDLPGSGGSPGHLTTLGIEESRDVAAVYTWAREEWPELPVILYGHSMGGAAIMRALALYDIKPDAAIVESVFDNLLDAIRERFRLLSAPPFPAAEILLFWGSVRLGVNGFSHDVTAYAREITTPVMLIHGDQDNRADWKRAHHVFDALQGPKAWLLVNGAGHVNPCVVDRPLWNQRVSEFIGTSIK